MRCPHCGHPESKVVDSRATDEGSAIRRRRECLSCERRFTTYETVEEPPLMVIKKDGRREPFDRNKILTGLMKACQKRPIPMGVLEQVTTEVERELRGRLDREVPSAAIGDLVVRKLRSLDKVAYVRFASVYREFKDIDTFMQELKRLHEEE